MDGFIALVSKLMIVVLHLINGVTQNYGLTLICFAVFVKGLLNPFTKPMLKAQKDMERIRPLQQALEEKYKSDPQKKYEALAELYKEHNVTMPHFGCLLMLVQLPIMLGILRAITNHPEEFNNAYFLWMRPGTLQTFFPNLFASSLADPDFALILVYGVMMLLYQQTTPGTGDPTQKQVGLMMSVMFTYMVWKLHWPCALVIYWSAFQFFGVLQQVLMIAEIAPRRRRRLAKFDWIKEVRPLEDDYDDRDDEDFEDEDELEEEEEDEEEEPPRAKATPKKAAPARNGNGQEEGEDEDDPIADLLFDIMDLMGIEAEIEFEEREDHVRYHIEGPELGVLIGRHGQTLEALQFLIGVINARRQLVDYRVVIDVEGYRERREKQLRELARRTAQRAAREGRKIVLAPMPAVDRRVIHMALANHDEVKTYSEGEEPDRCVVVTPGDHE